MHCPDSGVPHPELLGGCLQVGNELLAIEGCCPRDRRSAPSPSSVSEMSHIWEGHAIARKFCGQTWDVPQDISIHHRESRELAYGGLRSPNSCVQAPLCQACRPQAAHFYPLHLRQEYPLCRIAVGIQQDGVTSVPRASCLLVSVEMFVIPNWAGVEVPLPFPSCGGSGVCPFQNPSLLFRQRSL